VLKEVRSPNDLGGLGDRRSDPAWRKIDPVGGRCHSRLRDQAGEDNRNVARMSLLIAGALPITVAGQTVNRLCGSGLQAINSAPRPFNKCGRYFCGGRCFLESMTRAPLVLGKSDAAFSVT